MVIRLFIVIFVWVSFHGPDSIQAVLSSGHTTEQSVSSTIATELKTKNTHATEMKTSNTAATEVKTSSAQNTAPLTSSINATLTSSTQETAYKLDQDRSTPDDNCWMDINHGQILDELDELDSSFKKSRQGFSDAVGKFEFDKLMLDTLSSYQRKPNGAIHKGASGTFVPAGLNLGGYTMMRMPGTILFFQRMKLVNNTNFKINYITNDLENMLLRTALTLDDLPLTGAYQRSFTDSHDPSVLYFKPTDGYLDLLLRHGRYKVEGRYRLLNDRLVIQDVISRLNIDEMVAIYSNEKGRTMPIKFDKRLLGEFMQRLRLDLDHWLMDYLNDFLASFAVDGGELKNQVQNYDKKKALIVNNFVESTIDKMIYRLRQLRAIALKAHDFTIHSNKGTQFRLKNGVIRGLESMIRRSIGTTVKRGDVRNIDCIVNFSKLKIEYEYVAQSKTSPSTMTGKIVLTADGLAARMHLALIQNPEAFDVQFTFFDQTKPETLLIQGPLNNEMPKFRLIIETQVVSLLTNSLLHQIKMLDYLSHCTRAIPGHVDPDEIFEEPALTQKYDRVTYQPYYSGDNDIN